VHVDVKKQAKIPKGGGWRVNGVKGRVKNGKGGRPRLGYAYIHSAIDAHSRLAYSEIHANEQATTAIAFWRRAREFFASYGITVEKVLSDNGMCYRAKDFTAELVAAGIKHRFTRPYRPQTNGRSNGSTEPSRTSGPTPGPTGQRQPGPGPWTHGCTCTTIIGTTRPSADHPQVASNNLVGQNN